MSHRCAACGIAAFFSLCVASSSLHAAIVDTFSVGAGSKSATVQIDFTNGNGYLFDVRWSASSYTSWNAMTDIDAALSTVSLQFDAYPFGIFLAGVSVGSDTDYGQGDLWPIENFWHYWVKDSGSWEQAFVGAADHQLLDGGFDGWVFGSPVAPQSVPAPGAAMIGLASLLRTRRRIAG
ncbi:MAG: hypothetical protein K8R92_04300 [Planctomycetes bacterium]|nr:hypothetical protein [Planctomycetota bacterium]